MPPIESYRTVRWIRTINLVLQAALVLTLFGGLNYLAIHYHWRYDLSRHHRYSLSPETISYLGELKRPIRIVVTPVISSPFRKSCCLMLMTASKYSSGIPRMLTA